MSTVFLVSQGASGLPGGAGLPGKDGQAVRMQFFFISILLVFVSILQALQNVQVKWRTCWNMSLTKSA